MNYAEASYDHSKSLFPPSPPLPVYHFQHIARRDEYLRVQRREKIAAANPSKLCD